MVTENRYGSAKAIGSNQLFPVISSDLRPITEHNQCPLHPKSRQHVDVDVILIHLQNGYGSVSILT
jgi:hypothetical protein